MLTAKLILERFDKDNHLLEKREQPSRSFIRGLFGLLYCAHAQIRAAAPYNMTDVDGVARNIDSQSAAGASIRNVKGTLAMGGPPGLAGLYCPAGYDTNLWVYVQSIEGNKVGIQVGTGVGGPTPADTALTTRILHGTQANRLEYGGCELINLVFAGANGEFTIRRYFTNHSLGLITVQEAGIHAVGTFNLNVSTGSWPFLIARDLTGAVPVADTELLRVTYVVQITA